MAGFGGAVKLTGESEYIKAVKNITQSLKEVDSELKLVTSQYDKNDKSEKALADQSEVLNKKYDMQDQKLKALNANYKALEKQQEANKAKHKSLGEELNNEIKKLKDIEQASGKDSEAYKKQAEKVSALTSDYKKSSDAIEKNEEKLSKARIELKNTEASLNKTGKEIENLGKSAESGARDEEKLGKAAKEAGEDADKSAKGGFTVFKGVLADLAATAIKDVLSGLKDIGAAAKDAFSEFDEGRDKVIKATGATGKQAEELKESYKNVTKSVVGSYSDIGGVIGELNTRMGFTGDELESAATKFIKFADVTGVDAVTAVQSVSRAMNKAGIDSSDYGRVLDKLVTASQSTGVAVDRLTDSLTKYSAPMKNLGFTTDDTIALFSQFELAGVNVEQAFNGMQKAAANWAKDGKNASTEFTKLMDDIKNAPTDIDATQKAVEAFGSKTGVELADAIRSGKMEYSDLISTISSSHGRLESTFEGTQDASDKVKLAMQGLKTDLAEFVSKILTEYGPDIEKAINAIVPAIEWIIDNAFPAIKKGGEWIGDNVLPVINDFLGWINDNLETLLPLLAGLGGAIAVYKTWTIVTKAVAAAQALLNSVLSANPVMLVVVAIGALTAALTTLFFTNEDFREAVTDTWNKIKEGAQIVWDWLKTLFTETIPQALYDLGESIVTKGAEILEFIGTIPQKIGEFIGDILFSIDQFILDIGRKGANLVKDFGKWIGDVISDAAQFVIDLGKKGLDAIGDFVGNIIDGIISLPGKIKEKLDDILSNVASFATDFAQAALDAGKDFFTKLWNEVKDLPQKFIQLGKDCIDGFWKGFKKIFTSDALPVKDLVNDCKKELGINSPSKVFADEIGKNSALGIGVGFSKEMSRVSDEMKSAIPTSFDIDTATNVRGGYSFGGSYSFNELVSALKEALTGVDVELDDIKVGKFVKKTVTDAIYT